MDRVYRCCAGIDVHRDVLVVSVRTVRDDKETVRTHKFETFHDTTVAMVQWLQESGVEVVGLESTGDYWRLAVRTLQERAPRMTVWLVNPTAVKQLKGRKTDVSDSAWLSKLVMYGLVSASFLPPNEQEDLRKLTRFRVKLVGDSTRASNRVIKYLEANGIKLASVCSNVLGETGRRILRAMIQGETNPATLASLALGSLARKRNQLIRALEGGLAESSRFILGELLEQLEELEKRLGRVDEKISVYLKPFEKEAELLETVGGIRKIAAAAILAECGKEMTVFGTAKRLSAWAGVAPGVNESAGKSKRASALNGDKYLRTILVQVANSAVKVKKSYWQEQFKRTVGRLGYAKAVFRIAHKMLTAIFYMLRDGVAYSRPEQPGPTDEQIARQSRRLVQQLEAVGWAVTLTKKAEQEQVVA